MFLCKGGPSVQVTRKCYCHNLRRLSRRLLPATAWEWGLSPQSWHSQTWGCQPPHTLPWGGPGPAGNGSGVGLGARRMQVPTSPGSLWASARGGGSTVPPPSPEQDLSLPVPCAAGAASSQLPHGSLGCAQRAPTPWGAAHSSPGLLTESRSRLKTNYYQPRQKS